MSCIAFLHTTLHTPLELANPGGQQPVGAVSVVEVEPIGIEPTTSWLQTRRSPD